MRYSLFETPYGRRMEFEDGIDKAHGEEIWAQVWHSALIS